MRQIYAGDLSLVGKPWYSRIVAICPSCAGAVTDLDWDDIGVLRYDADGKTPVLVRYTCPTCGKRVDISAAGLNQSPPVPVSARQ